MTSGKEGRMASGTDRHGPTLCTGCYSATSPGPLIRNRDPGCYNRCYKLQHRVLHSQKPCELRPPRGLSIALKTARNHDLPGSVLSFNGLRGADLGTD